MQLLRRFVAVVVCPLAVSSAIAMEPPRWIWSNGQREGRSVAAFRTTFPSPAGRPSVDLWLANAYCDCEIVLNGKSIHRLRPYHQPSRLVLGPLRPGENELGLICHSVGGPSAVAAILPLDEASQVTDRSWQAADLTEVTRDWQDLTDAAWAEPALFGLLDTRAWISDGIATNVADDYTQWKRALQQTGSTAADQLDVQPGFQVEQLCSAGEGEGSWISLAQEPQGRWVVGHEDEGLLRLTLQASGPVRVEKLPLPASECRGLVFAHNSLYVMGNKTLTLLRVQDTDGDDQFDKIEPLKKFPGGTGHGRNQLTLGPDGRVYAIFGDSVQQPDDAKYLPPVVPHPDEVQQAQNGFVARTDARGTSWEVVVRGLRNPYGLDFNRHGDLFTYDADAEYDMGSSWYRPTRVLHLVPGGDYGWRSVTQRWPPYDPDSATMPQPTLDIGRGSPTAVEFVAGDNFPAAYRDTLFALDWSYGRILAVHLRPCGSSYVGAAEVFLRGSPLNVTDIEFGRDGALYFVTGGRQTQSGLYRVRYVGDQIAVPQQTPQQAAVSRHAEVARQQLRQLQSLCDHPPPDALEAAWKQLAASDPWIRHAARTAIESLPVDAWRDRTFQESNLDRFLAAALALIRFGEDHDRQRLGQQLVSLDARNLLPWQQTEWAELCLRLLDTGDPQDPKWNPLFDKLRMMFPMQRYPFDRLASQLLAQRDDGALVPPAMQLLEESSQASDQRQQMHWLTTLSTLGEGWTLELRERYFTALRDMDRFEAGEGMPTFRRLIRDAALDHIPQELRAPWQASLDEQAGERLPELPPARTAIVKQWSADDFADLEQALDNGTDRQRGREMFTTARCVVCHRVGTQGGVSGPDLTGVARRFSARDLLASILEPSAVVSEKYANTLFELADGRLLSGRVRVTDYRSPNAELVPDLLAPDKTITFSKQEIVDRRVSPVSPMPKGLVDGLARQEVLDLLAYLLAGE